MSNDLTFDVSIPKDYKPPKGGGENRKTNPDGVYQVKGLKFFRTKNTDTPYLKARKDGNMSAGLNFLFEGEGSQPYFPLWENVPQLVTAFLPKVGKKIELPTMPSERDPASVANYLLAIERMINNAETTTQISVKGGWVDSIEGMFIPDGTYYWRIIKTISHNTVGLPSWETKVFSDGGSITFVRLMAEVLANAAGQAFEYTGAQFPIQVPYSLVYDPGEEVLGYKKTEDGQFRLDSDRHQKTWLCFAPDFWMDRNAIAAWPDKSNLVPLWIQKVDSKKAAFCHITTKGEGGWKVQSPVYEQITPMDLPYFINPIQINGGTQVQNQTSQQVSKPATTLNVNESQSDVVQSAGKQIQIDEDARKLFIKYVNLFTEKTAMNPDFSLTSDGISWAKSVLTPLKENGKIPALQFSTMSFEETLLLIEESLNVYQGDKKSELESLRGEVQQLPIKHMSQPIQVEEVESPY